MGIKIRDLRKAVTTTPPIETLLGGQVARKDRVLSVHAQADSLLGNARNVVARVGLHAASTFQTLSANPNSALQIYPLRTISRTVARTPSFSLLPGHYLLLSALVVPSGMTQKFVSGAWAPDIVHGRIDVSINWVGPVSTTTNHSVLLPNSGETWGAESTAAGASWAGLRRVEIPLMFPAAVTTNASDLRAWSDGGVTADVTVAYRGGARAVDVVVQQVPFKYARNVGVDAAYASTLVTTGAGDIVPAYPVDYPIEARSATDPTFGSKLLADVTDRQQHGFGPVLAFWTSFTESTTAVTATVAPNLTTTSTTYVDLLRTSVTAWSSTRPGWSLSSGGHAQQFKSSNGLRELRDRNACIPVRCWALCSRAGTGTAVIRFQSENFSIAELNVASTTHMWRFCTGHLRAGVAAEDASVLEVFGKAVAGGSLSISSIFIEYRDL